ncbi:MAG TPA: tetrahydrofolate dehydrogenase/cyclohydrolase catalytic domain-containing protein [bacterium]|nr:tetrahydrofolate dehydrogenase/cyclohydrolase catalytic domain-containing protein [bacterium]
MTARILRGTETSALIRDELRDRVAGLRAQGIAPALGVVLVGEDPASVSYVTAKAKGAAEVGIDEETIRLPEATSETDVLEVVRQLNEDPRFHGLLVQLPLPGHIKSARIIEATSPEKDVDAFHPINVGRLLRGEPCPLPCTPHGVVQMLVRNGYDPGGRHVVICGRSNLVGKPLAAMLIQKRPGANATVTLCHTATRNLAAITRQADILVAAMGRPRAITADMVSSGTVVIDVGVNRIPDAAAPKGFRLVGDCNFDALKETAEAITPVPGGVGPMTVTMLLLNVVEAAERVLAARGEERKTA